MQILNCADFIRLPDDTLYYVYRRGQRPRLGDLRIRGKMIDDQSVEGFIKFYARRFFDDYGRPIDDGNVKTEWGRKMCVKRRRDTLFAVYSSEDKATIFSRFHVDIGTAKNPCEYELKQKAVGSVEDFFKGSTVCIESNGADCVEAAQDAVTEAQ